MMARMAMKRWMSTSIGRAWNKWCDEVRRTRLGKKVAKRWVHRALSRAWQSWELMVMETRRLRSIAGKVVARWMEAHPEAAEEQQRLDDVAKSLNDNPADDPDPERRWLRESLSKKGIKFGSVDMDTEKMRKLNAVLGAGGLGNAKPGAGDAAKGKGKGKKKKKKRKKDQGKKTKLKASDLEWDGNVARLKKGAKDEL